MSSVATTPACAAASTCKVKSIPKAAAGPTSTKSTTSPAGGEVSEDDDLEAQLQAAFDEDSKANGVDEADSSVTSAYIAAASRVKIPAVSQRKKKGKVETEAEKKAREAYEAKLEAEQASLFAGAAARHPGGVPVVDVERNDVGVGGKERGEANVINNDVTAKKAATKQSIDVQKTSHTQPPQQKKPFGGLALPRMALPKGHMYPEEIAAAKAEALAKTKPKTNVRLQGGRLVRDHAEFKVSPGAEKDSFTSMVEVVENGLALTPDTVTKDYEGVASVGQGLKNTRMGFANLKMKVLRHSNGAIDIVISGSNQAGGSTVATPAAPSKKRKHTDADDGSSKRTKNMQEVQGVNGVSTPSAHTIDLTNDDDGGHATTQKSQVPVTPTAPTKRKRGADDDGDVSSEAGTGRDTPQTKKHRTGASSYMGENSSSGEGSNEYTAGGADQNAPIDVNAANSSNDTMPPPPRPVKPATSRYGGSGSGAKPPIGMNMQSSSYTTDDEYSTGFEPGTQLQYNHLSDGPQPAANGGQHTGGQGSIRGSQRETFTAGETGQSSGLSFNQSFAESRKHMTDEERQFAKSGKNPYKYNPNGFGY